MLVGFVLEFVFFSIGVILLPGKKIPTSLFIPNIGDIFPGLSQLCAAGSVRAAELSQGV